MIGRANAQIDMRCTDATITIDTPPTAIARSAPRLETALWELFDNAATHAAPNPTIDIDVSTTDDNVHMQIVDDGPGIPETERAVLAAADESHSPTAAASASGSSTGSSRASTGRSRCRMYRLGRASIFG